MKTFQRQAENGMLAAALAFALSAVDVNAQPSTLPHAESGR
jgi:hypothetical protein